MARTPDRITTANSVTNVNNTGVGVLAVSTYV